MIGGLIEKQQVGFQGQRQCQRRTLLLTARGLGRIDGAVELKARGELDQARFAAPAPPLIVDVLQAAALAETFEQGVGRRQHRFLFDADQAQSIATLYFAIIECDAARHDPKQGRFASAIAADQTNAIAFIERAGGLIEQRREAVGELGG